MNPSSFVRTALPSALLMLAIFSTGCLSLSFGGRTVNCENGGKHSDDRVAQLERRIKALEHYAGIPSPTSDEKKIGLVSVITESSVDPPAPTPLR